MPANASCPDSCLGSGSVQGMGFLLGLLCNMLQGAIPSMRAVLQLLAEKNTVTESEASRGHSWDPALKHGATPDSLLAVPCQRRTSSEPCSLCSVERSDTSSSPALPAYGLLEA